MGKEKQEIQEKKEEKKIRKKSEFKKEEKQKRTKCERYSRVVGYIRPVEQWNEGKQAEWHDRKHFEI